MFTKAEHTKEIERLAHLIAKAKAKGKDYSTLEERMHQLMNE